VRVEHLDQDVVDLLLFHFALFSRYRPMVFQNRRTPGCVSFQAVVFLYVIPHRHAESRGIMPP
jgi:hypothetical protein